MRLIDVDDDNIRMIMKGLKPCPFCGCDVVPICKGDVFRHPVKECFLDGMQFSAYRTSSWNTRDGEPERICANCKRWADGKCGMHDTDTLFWEVCDKWENENR